MRRIQFRKVQPIRFLSDMQMLPERVLGRLLFKVVKILPSRLNPQQADSNYLNALFFILKNIIIESFVQLYPKTAN